VDYTRLGSSGLKVSPVCLGMMSYGDKGRRAWFLSEEEAVPIVRRAVELGVNFFDTANMYSNGLTEEITGRLLSRLFTRRDDYVLATKCFAPTGNRPWHAGTSRSNIMRAVEASLRRLQTDFIDLYQIHFWDPSTPTDETLTAMDDLVRQGKVRYVGCSNTLAYQLARSIGRSEVLQVARYDSVQPRYNLLFRENERELFPLCEEEGVAVIPYNPLAGGFLSGKYTNGEPPAGTRFTLGTVAGRYQERYWHERMFETVEAIRPIAAEVDMTMAQLAVAWVLAKPVITSPIVGASRPEQLADPVAAVATPLEPELVARLDELTYEYRFGDNGR